MDQTHQTRLISKKTKSKIDVFSILFSIQFSSVSFLARIYVAISVATQNKGPVNFPGSPFSRIIADTGFALV